MEDVNIQVHVSNNEGIVNTPTVFSFELETIPKLKLKPDSGLGVGLSGTKVILTIDESQVINTPRTITKTITPYLADSKKGFIEITFPESLAGATLRISYLFINLSMNQSFIALAKASHIKIKMTCFLIIMLKILTK
jgi:hypothetical protein